MSDEDTERKTIKTIKLHVIANAARQMQLQTELAAQHETLCPRYFFYSAHRHVCHVVHDAV